MQKCRQLQGAKPPDPHQVLCPWTPLGTSPQDPLIGSRSAFAMIGPQTEFLDPQWILHRDH